MDIILVPGFWLDASSWAEVTPPLVTAGHRVHPLTLPGLESVDTPRADIGLRDHVDAVVAARVDRLILIGDEMAPLAASLTWRAGIDRAATVDDAGKLLFADLRPGDAVLIKASNSVGLAKLVERMVGEMPCFT